MHQLPREGPRVGPKLTNFLKRVVAKISTDFFQVVYIDFFNNFLEILETPNIHHEIFENDSSAREPNLLSRRWRSRHWLKKMSSCPSSSVGMAGSSRRLFPSHNICMSIYISLDYHICWNWSNEWQLWLLMQLHDDVFRCCLEKLGLLPQTGNRDVFFVYENN